jgi:type I restriction enzyme S subunit
MVVTVKEARPEFAAFALLAAYVRDEQLVVASLRAAQPHLNAEELGSALVVVPSLHEQEAIAGYLDKTTSEVDAATARAHRQIDLFREYRTRLIADVVTGKLDVRGTAAAPVAGWSRGDTIHTESHPHAIEHDMAQEAIS